MREKASFLSVKIAMLSTKSVLFTHDFIFPLRKFSTFSLLLLLLVVVSGDKISCIKKQVEKNCCENSHKKSTVNNFDIIKCERSNRIPNMDRAV